MQAVVNRSNSRNCGKMSALVVTKAPGISSATISAARRSWLGFRYENRKQTATEPTPACLSAFAAARTSFSSSGSSTSPPGGAIRSVTTCRCRRLTNGRACHGMSCMIE